MNTQAMTWIKNGVFIVAFVFGVISPFYQIKQELALVKQSIEIIQVNHLQHIQDLSQQQKEQQTQIFELQKQLWIAIGGGE